MQNDKIKQLSDKEEVKNKDTKGKQIVSEDEQWKKN